MEVSAGSYDFIYGILILLMFVFVFAYPKFHADQVMAAFFGFFYVAVMLSYVYVSNPYAGEGLYLAFLYFYVRGDAIPVHIRREC